MSMDIEFSLDAKGNKEQLLSMIQATKAYMDGENDISFFSLYIQLNDHQENLSAISDEKIQEIAESGKFSAITYDMDAAQLYDVNEVDFFKFLAEAAPGASYVSEIRGGSSYDLFSYVGELENGILHMSTHYQNYEDMDEYEDNPYPGFDRTVDYAVYFASRLSCLRFNQIFHTDFSEESYLSMISDAFIEIEESFTDLSLEEFSDTIFREVHIDLEEYENAMNDLQKLKILNYEAFVSSYPPGKEYNYDPVKKEYLPAFELSEKAMLKRQKDFDGFICRR